MNGCSPSPPADQLKTNGESAERHHSTPDQSIMIHKANLICSEWQIAILPSCSAVCLHLRWIFCNDKTTRLRKAELGHLSLTSNAPCTDASCTFNNWSDYSALTCQVTWGAFGQAVAILRHKPSNKVKEKCIFLLSVTLINSFMCQNHHAVNQGNKTNKKRIPHNRHDAVRLKNCLSSKISTCPELAGATLNSQQKRKDRKIHNLVRK